MTAFERLCLNLENFNKKHCQLKKISIKTFDISGFCLNFCKNRGDTRKN